MFLQVEPDTNDEVVEEIIEVQPGPSTFLLQKKEESILDIKLLEDAGIETAPINGKFFFKLFIILHTYCHAKFIF